MTTDRGSREIVTPKRHERYDRTDIVRGLQFVVGWQFDRMLDELPKPILYLWLVLAGIWLCVAIWAGQTRDWDTALAFGQCVLASVTLIAWKARE